MDYSNGSLEIVKNQAKEKFAELVESYASKHSNAINERKYTIDMVEDFLTFAKAEADHILKETARDLMKAAEAELVEKKKYVQGADIS